MRQAFKALLRLPATQYLAPGESSDAIERENATYEQLVEEPVHCNPYLSRGTPKRASREQEIQVYRFKLCQYYLYTVRPYSVCRLLCRVLRLNTIWQKSSLF
jgi:hypothetical protein